MELMNPWVKQGWDEGKQVGKEELVIQMIRHRFGSVSGKIEEQLDHLSSEQLDDLGKALFDLNTTTDLEAWLSRHPQR